MGKLSMIGHIKDTPRVIKKAYNLRNEYGKEFIQTFTNHNFKRVYFLGSGTSYNASLVIRNMFVEVLGIDGIAIIPNIFTNHEQINPNQYYNKDEVLIIGLSQHGDSISTLEALKRAKAEGYYTIGITEAEGSEITKIADQTLYLVCEEEEIGPETRGYTATLFQMYILAIEIAKEKELINLEDYNQLDLNAKYVMDNLKDIINESIEWYNQNRNELLAMKKCAISGYGPNYPTALEGRLKLFETFSQPCTGYEQEELMHLTFKSIR